MKNFKLTFTSGEIHMLCANSADHARSLCEGPKEKAVSVEEVSNEEFGAWLSGRTPAGFGDDEQDMDGLQLSKPKFEACAHGVASTHECPKCDGDTGLSDCIICSECGAEMPNDTYARTFGRCAKHADGE